MSVNKAIAERLEQSSQLMELLGENKFRVAALARAGRVIADYPTDLSALDKKELMAIDGIGDKVADKILEYCETGKIQEHVDLLAKVPKGLIAVMDVPGLGPKSVKLLWDELGVEDIDGLKRVIEDGSMAGLPRMGKKKVESVKESLEFAEKSGGRLPLGLAMPIAEALAERVSAMKGVKQCAYAGSLRRGKETIGDIDLLVVAKEPDTVMEAFREMDGVQRVLASGETKSSVIVSADVDHGRWKGDDDPKRTVQVDLRVVPDASWGAAIMYFTGSKEHNVRLRERAQKQDTTLNEYGLYPEDGEKEPPQKRGVKAVAGKTEESVYDALEVPYCPPEIREDRGELDLDETPELVTVEDVKAELHAHTNESDGKMPLTELVKNAKARGFHTIAVTDHSKSSVIANGLNEERLEQQREEIDALREKTKGITILHGCEVDILTDGSLDYGDDVIEWLEVVVASPHVALSLKGKEATKRLIKAIEHPNVNIIGHPTGRLIGRRAGMEPDMGEVIAAAKANDVALEINAHWMRLDLRDTHVRAAVDAGVGIAIDCDVHVPEDFENLRYGVMTGRRGWLPPELCVNTWSKTKLHTWLAAKH